MNLSTCVCWGRRNEGEQRRKTQSLAWRSLINRKSLNYFLLFFFVSVEFREWSDCWGVDHVGELKITTGYRRKTSSNLLENASDALNILDKNKESFERWNEEKKTSCKWIKNSVGPLTPVQVERTSVLLPFQIEMFSPFSFFLKLPHNIFFPFFLHHEFNSNFLHPSKNRKFLCCAQEIGNERLKCRLEYSKM